MFNLDYQCQLFVYICILLTEKASEKAKKANDQRDRGGYEKRDGDDRRDNRGYGFDRRDNNDRDRGGFDRYDRNDRGGDRGFDRYDRSPAIWIGSDALQGNYSKCPVR